MAMKWRINENKKMDDDDDGNEDDGDALLDCLSIAQV